MNIIIVEDPRHTQTAAQSLAFYLARLNGARLTAVFTDYPADNHAAYERFIDKDAPYVHSARHQAAVQERAISSFSQACLAAEVAFTIHRDSGDMMEDSIAESVFADLLILPEHLSYPEDDDERPSRLVKDLLIRSHCPVMIAPVAFHEPDEIVFAYDGTERSMYALKQFGYLFPKCRDMALLVVEVNEDKTLQEGERLGEWLAGRFTNVRYEIFEGAVNDRLLEVMLSKKAAILLLGAYGRDALSRLFLKSTAEDILRLSAAPVFIAHR